MQHLIAVSILFHISWANPGIDTVFIDDGFRRVNEVLIERFRLGNATYGPIKERWIEQPLDHFNSSVNHPWRLKYFQRLDLWKPKGPIYLMIGGEGYATPEFLISGQMVEMAQETNGAMFVSEHRYYGVSEPFKELDTDKLKYLNSKQALADFNALLEHIKSDNRFESSKVVLVGRFYGGNLAAWMKVLYPAKVHAVLACSAPVLAKLDFYEYMETLGDVFKKYGTKGCYEFIENKFNLYAEAFKTQEGVEKLKKTENICDYSDMNRSENQQVFIHHKLFWFMKTAEYGDVTRVKEYCNEIMNSSSLYGLNLENLHSKQCRDFNFEKELLKIKRSLNNRYPWVYQMCSGFGYFRTTSSDRHPFTKNIKIDIFYKMCMKILGAEFNEKYITKAVEDTNKLYGGLKPKVENVYFVNGELDPWHRLNVLEDLSDNVPAILIPGASQCYNLYPSHSSDPPAMAEAKIKIRQTIIKWIQ